MSKYERHVFVCNNVRAAAHPRGCCCGKGSEALVVALKTAVGRHGLSARVHINKSGCLDQCEHGPTVVVYPDAVWYGFVKPEDAEDIVAEHLAHGRPVARLILPDTCINTGTCGHRRG